ncbi:MAG: SIS domain-containing protein [Deltaproteobacteria bacterium]|nr:SIS domain-containing protein [Deltaproteobacteria bacterium]
MSTERLIRQVLKESIRVKEALDPAAIARTAELMRDAVLAGKKVLLVGNGGSAADAQHIAAELVGRFVVERRPLAAIALTTDTSALTAIANDYGYEHVFSRQVDALGAEGDILIAITTSGTSKNVLAAVDVARKRGMKIIGLTGAKGAAFVASCDAGVAVPSTVTARVQECHIAIGHLLCEVVDESFAPSPEVVIGNGHAPAKELLLEQLVAWREAQRARKRQVVWTNGVFDVFHIGHLESLRAARAFGDVLVVGVNDDASVRSNKGPDRPIFPCAERVAILAALEIVDAILVFGDSTPERVLAAVKPDVHVKGADYANKAIPERSIVEAYGGRVELVPLVPGRSSTDALAKLRS